METAEKLISNSIVWSLETLKWIGNNEWIIPVICISGIAIVILAFTHKIWLPMICKR